MGIIGDAVLWMTLLIFHLFQLIHFANQFALVAVLGLSFSLLVFILHAMPRGLTLVCFHE